LKTPLRWKTLLLILIVAVASTHHLVAQEAGKAKVATNGFGQDAVALPGEKNFAGYNTSGGWKNAWADFGLDQKQIWTSPWRIRFGDSRWLVPLAGITAGLFVADRQYAASLPQGSSTISRYKTISNVGVAGLAGAGAGMYVMSFPLHNQHWRETGFLAGEAALDSLIPAELMKYTLRRERPYQGDGGGSLFHGGTSFPSEHSAVSWSIAGVIAHEYPGMLPQLLAYGTAAAVDFSRVRSRQHFPSDVLVGSVLGYLTAQNVYRRRHDPELGGRAWESPGEFISSDPHQSPAFLGSPYVPLDSWVYPALERLAALGYIKTAVLGLRPWTRSECARLLSEAAELGADGGGTADTPQPSAAQVDVQQLEVRQVEAQQLEVQQLYDSLAEEFGNESETGGGENLHTQVESVYVRTTGIAGRPLTDNEHFGQTILNDYGRPYQQGFNTIVGASSWAVWGPFVIYGRGEYQSAPSAPAPSEPVLEFIASADGLPPNPPQVQVAAIQRMRLLEGYVGMNLAHWQISFGKQSLWWGPGEQGAMLVTNNAEALNKMFRLSRTSPIHLPSVFGYLGDIRMEFFLGQLAGQEFINNVWKLTNLPNPPTLGQYGVALHPPPTLSGGKISFKFTSNFEISMSKTTIYGGPGNPVTLKTLFQSAFAEHVHGSALGDGQSALDFAYRIPKLRDWLSFYGDASQKDEISPLDRPYKAAFQGGLYLARVPQIPQLDFRLEGGTTIPVNFPTCTACYYHDGQYRSGSTNNGELIGTWIGRAAQGEAIRSNYWLGPRKKVGIELRHRKVGLQYLPQGGTQNDAGVNADFLLASGLRLSGGLQYESWQIPLLASNRQNNLTTWFQIGYWPQGRLR
jgi:membrane-associated phospholipid phosphatase